MFLLPPAPSPRFMMLWPGDLEILRIVVITAQEAYTWGSLLNAFLDSLTLRIVAVDPVYLCRAGNIHVLVDSRLACAL